MWQVMSEYERFVIGPHRVCVYPAIGCRATSVPCFPVDMKESLETTAEELLKHGSLLRGLFCTHDYDFSREGVGAARAYLAEIVESSDSTSPELLEFRAPLPPMMHSVARLWFTQLARFAPGYDE